MAKRANSSEPMIPITGLGQLNILPWAAISLPPLLEFGGLCKAKSPVAQGDEDVHLTMFAFVAAEAVV